MDQSRARRRALCALPVLAAGFACACAEVGPPPERRVILISLDTLRADHLSVYGYERDTCPNLERLVAEDAVVFERAFSQAPWTLPSHMSIFTGLYPLAHGVIDAEKRLSPEISTLTELLRSSGCATTAFTDGGYMAGKYGFEDGFEEYRDDSFMPQGTEPGFAKVLPFVDQWLREKLASGTFLFLHTYDLHTPYRIGEPWRSAFRPESAASPQERAQIEYLASLGKCDSYELERYQGMHEFVATYDGMILWVDHVLGRLFAILRELGIYDDTLIVITSDHGESFLEEGVYVGHGAYLNDAETHIPLIIKFPGGRFGGQRCRALVESIDILPTILSALRVPAPPGLIVQGVDLIPLLEGEPDPSPVALSFFGYVQQQAIRTEEWSLITPVADEQVDRFIAKELLARDPELVKSRIGKEDQLRSAGSGTGPNLVQQMPEIHAQLRQQLETAMRASFAVNVLVGQPGKREQFSPREIERLKQLGYL